MSNGVQNGMLPFNGNFINSKGEIQNLDSIGGGGGGREVTGFGEIDFPVELRTGTLYSFVTSSGDYFFSSDGTSTIGIWHINKDTNTFEQLYPTAVWPSWFEDSNGNVFAGGSRSSLLKWNGVGFDEVYPAFGWSSFKYWYETKTGDVLVSAINDIGDSRILKWNGTSFDKVYEDYSQYTVFFEHENGRVFASAYDRSAILRLDLTRLEGFVEYEDYTESEAEWRPIFYASNGHIFFTAKYDYGILRYDGQRFTNILSGSGRWESGFETSSGDIFIAGDGNEGIAHTTLTEMYATIVYNGAGRFGYWFEDSSKNVFLSPDANVNGIFKWNGSTFVSVYSSGNKWQYWFETPGGVTFVSCSSTLGLLRWTGTAFTTAISSYQNGIYRFVDSKNDVFLSGTAVNSGVQKLNTNGTTWTKIFQTGSEWKTWYELPNGNSLTSSSVGQPGIFLWNGTALTSIYPFGYDWEFEKMDGKILCQSKTEAVRLLYDTTFNIYDFYLPAMAKPLNETIGIYDASIIVEGTNFSVLNNLYLGNPVVFGNYSYVLLADKSKILYTK